MEKLILIPKKEKSQSQTETSLIDKSEDNKKVLTNNEFFIKNVDEGTTNISITNQLLTKVEKVNFIKIIYPDSTTNIEEYRILKEKFNTLNEDGSLNPDALNKKESERIKQLQKIISSYKIEKKHYLIISIEELLQLALDNNWNLCKNQSFVYLYNGNYWNLLDDKQLQNFLGEVAEKMSVPKYDSRLYLFRDELFKQFLSTAYLPTPERSKDKVLINLLNGTFEITVNGQKLRKSNHEDFLTHQLNFEYKPDATAPLFVKYLNKVLPDEKLRKVLAEFLGYIFVSTRVLKLEKVLILYGQGANGKSVMFEILNSLLGSENFSSYSLQNLTDTSGYYRAMIANKLVNFASEINGSLQTNIFKQLGSGEPTDARLPYKEPMLISDYAKLIFNCNELPKDVEHTHAYFRRFLIIPFDVTIPEAEQDKELSKKIATSELSGVFNWILDGLNRLLKQKRFTQSDKIDNQILDYKAQSDSVQLFLNESGYQSDPTETILIKNLYIQYRTFCYEDGYMAVGKMNFRKRLENCKVLTAKITEGNVAYLK